MLQGLDKNDQSIYWRWLKCVKLSQALWYVIVWFANMCNGISLIIAQLQITVITKHIIVDFSIQKQLIAENVCWTLF